jgi:hypothetical protein
VRWSAPALQQGIVKQRIEGIEDHRGAADVESIAEAFRAVCSQSVPDDGVEFDTARHDSAPIREELKYGGVRIRPRPSLIAREFRCRSMWDSATQSRSMAAVPEHLGAEIAEQRAFPMPLAERAFQNQDTSPRI